MRFFFLIFISLVLTTSIYAQQEVDSLIQEVRLLIPKNKTKEAAKKLDGVDTTSISSVQNNYLKFLRGQIAQVEYKYKEAQKYYRQVIDVSCNEKEFTLYAKACYANAITYYREAIYDSTEIYAHKVFRIKEFDKYYEKSRYVLETYNLLGVLAKRHGDIEEGINYYKKGLEESLSKNYGYPNLFYNNISNAYYANKKYIPAVEYILQSIRYSINNNHFLSIANGYLTLSGIYTKQGDAQKSMEMLDLADYHLCFDDTEETLTVYYSIQLRKAALFIEQNEIRRAKEYLAEVQDYLEENPDGLRQSQLESNYAKIFLKEREYKKAHSHLQKADSLIMHHKYKNREAGIQLLQGLLLKAQNKTESAIEAFKETISLNQKYNKDFSQLYQAYHELTELYERTGNLTEALNFSKQALLQKDSLLSQVFPSEVNNLIIRFNNEREKLALKYQRDLAEKAAKKRKVINTLLGLLSVSLLLSLFFLHKINQGRKNFSEKLKVQVEKKTEELRKANVKITQSQEELRLFYAVIAHDLRYPILHIQAQLAEIVQGLGTEKTKQLKIANQSLQSLYDSFARLVEFFQMDAKPLEIKSIETKLLIEDILIELRRINALENLKVKMNELINIQADVLLIRQVFINIITNASKHCKQTENPVLEIFSEENTDGTLIYFKDNGPGIPSNIQNNLFHSFVSERKSKKDNFGIGLFIVKRIVERHQGDIRVSENTHSSGTIFTLFLPKLHR